MTDYLNLHKIYPDDISRRIDIPPGFDSVRDGADSHAGDETENLLTHLLENGSAMTADESKVMNDSIERLYKKTGRKIMPAVKESLTTALDENGLAQCGCGGKAILFHQPDIEGPGSDGDRWAVFCEKTCGMETSDMTSREYAVETWNTGMGYTAPSRPGAIVPDVREETGGKQMRMHEILGAEPGEEFCFDSKKYKYMVSDQGYLLYDKFGVGWADVTSIDRLTEIINHPDRIIRIIRKPRLTDGQIEALMILRIHFGAHWLTTDGPEDDRFVEVFSDKEKPKINKGFWFGKDWFNLGFETPIRKKIEPLLNPNEPLDIVQTLKDAGVEV